MTKTLCKFSCLFQLQGFKFCFNNILSNTYTTKCARLYIYTLRMKNYNAAVSCVKIPKFNQKQCLRFKSQKLGYHKTSSSFSIPNKFISFFETSLQLKVMNGICAPSDQLFIIKYNVLSTQQLNNVNYVSENMSIAKNGQNKNKYCKLSQTCFYQ